MSANTPIARMLGATAILAGWVALPALAAPGGNSAATISAAFADSCRSFVAHSSKDISHVELHYVDGRILKDESIGGPDFAIAGGAEDGLEFAIVKSGTTRQLVECTHANSAPVARLEIRTPPFALRLDSCFDFFAGGLFCDQTSARTEWTPASAVPDIGGSDSGILHWGCGTDYALCSYTVSFRGIGSSDPDGDIVSWSLDFGDGTSTSGDWTTATPTQISHDYSMAPCGPTDNRLCVITLTVTDSAGQRGSESLAMYFLDVNPD
jgi:hypothetical protein